MGCSKSFSISGGMGAALLTKPELIHDVSSSEIFDCSVVHHSYFSLLDEFGVEGIPHFAFLDKDGNEEGNIVGHLLRKFVLENADALARGETTVSHARLVGQYSSAEAWEVHQVVDQRSHE